MKESIGICSLIVIALYVAERLPIRKSESMTGPSLNYTKTDIL